MNAHNASDMELATKDRKNAYSLPPINQKRPLMREDVHNDSDLNE
jgi:hypothetical protein